MIGCLLFTLCSIGRRDFFIKSHALFNKRVVVLFRFYEIMAVRGKQTGGFRKSPDKEAYLTVVREEKFDLVELDRK